MGLVLSAALPARADWADACRQDESPILRIEGCTRLIEETELNNAELAWAHNNRGLAYQAIERYDKAITEFNLALTLAPENAAAYNNRANTYAYRGDLERALADHSRAIELDPDYAHAYYNRGADHEELGDLEAAVADYGRAFEADPDYAPALSARASLNCELGNHDAAVEDHALIVERGFVEAEEMQRRLKAAGHYAGKIDGVFGPGSRRALRNWTEAGCPEPPEDGASAAESAATSASEPADPDQ